MWAAVRDIALSIEHVGSTAVPGLAAKPVIDIDVVVTSRDKVPQVIERLGALGYLHRGNLGIEDREAFVSPSDRAAHHLYATLQGSVALANHLALRDFLRGNPQAAAEYGRLKKHLAAQFPDDVDRYTTGKTEYILTVLRNCGITEPLLRAISDANRPTAARGE